MRLATFFGADDLALAFSVMPGMALLATAFAFAFLLAASILAAAASILGGGRRGHRRSWDNLHQ